jgi:Tol biopolymer transport system component
VSRLGPLVAAFLMICFGFGVYTALGHDRSLVRAASTRKLPTATKPAAFILPGSLYVTQQGALYRLRAGSFTQLQPAGGWTQPAVSRDGSRLVLVKRQFNVSDLFLMDANGAVQSQVTHNGSTITEVNRWAFYPRFAPSGSIFFSQDQPKVYDYRVDLAIWEIPSGRPATQARRWTSPNFYTGGDVSPVPLPSGGLVYSKYDVSDAGQSFSQVWLAAGPDVAGTALTVPADDCGQPAVSPDGGHIALVCVSGATSRLMVAPWDGATVGPAQALVTGPVVGAPAWAPDSSGLVYFAPPATGAGNFQLWWIPLTGATAKQVTTGLDLDSTTPAAWGP